MAVMDEVTEEICKADDRFGGFTSTHEGYGVLAEEVSELLEAIRSNKAESVRHEAIQVAAVAMRLAISCRDNEAFNERSGF
jgi:NTP pyrophosphatase (non-canonical NTP hydrolase)